MKAFICERYGTPNVLQLKEIEMPLPQKNELLIKVKAATVNRTDCAILWAKPFIMRFVMGFLGPRKNILGTDFSGEVEAIGENISNFKVGDKVFGFDDMVLSSHAEYLTIDENGNVELMPENISFAEAAAGSEGFHYAFNFLNKVNLEKGDKVLVNGATGAIGSAAVQLLAHHGAEITAVCDTKNKDLIKSIGANRTIDYLKEDFTKVNQKYDYIFDTVGKSSFFKCKHLLKNKGVYISSELGWMAQNLFLTLYFVVIKKLFGRDSKSVKFPYPADIKRSLRNIRELMHKGKFKPVIDQAFPFEKIPDAYRYVEKGFKTGNVVIILEAD